MRSKKLVTKQGDKKDDQKYFSKVCDRYRTPKSRSKPRSKPTSKTTSKTHANFQLIESLKRSVDSIPKTQSNIEKRTSYSPTRIQAPLTEPPRRISRKHERKKTLVEENGSIVSKNLLKLFNDLDATDRQIREPPKTGYELFLETENDLDNFVQRYQNCNCCGGFIFCCKYYANKVCFCHHI